MNLQDLKRRAQELIGSGKFRDARSLYEEICRTDPGDAEAWFMLGAVHGRLGSLTEAISSNRRALELKQDYPEAHYNLARALQETGEFAEAERSYRETLKLKPGNPDACNNLGNVLRGLGRPREALEMFEKALAINPEHPPARCNRSLAWLLLGDFARGWPEFEWRWARSEHPPRRLPGPQWDGADLHGKTLLVHAEQGYGDTIQFARYLPLLKQRGARIVCECQPPLTRLLRTMRDIDTVVTQGDTLPPFDLHVPLLSLPRIFASDATTIPARTPYLAVPDGNYTQIESVFATESDGYRIGFVWAGSPVHVNDRNRSCGLEHFRALSALDGIRLYSLQKGQCAEELKRNNFSARDLSVLLGDFADTAYAVTRLDLVITVDTSVAHLAGALARPVWTLLPFDPDWRWMLERQDSPWYPGMRLFRQPRPGDWDDVFRRVTAALKQRTDA